MPPKTNIRNSGSQKDGQFLASLTKHCGYHVEKLSDGVRGRQPRTSIELNLGHLRKIVASIREFFEHRTQEIDISSCEPELELLERAVQQLVVYFHSESTHMSRPIDGLLFLDVVEKNCAFFANVALELQSGRN